MGRTVSRLNAACRCGGSGEALTGMPTLSRTVLARWSLWNMLLIGGGMGFAAFGAWWLRI